LMSDGEVRRGFLGVTIGDVTPDLAQGFGVEPKGALVNDVNPDTPAANAGIQPGDIIVNFDGKEVVDVAALRFVVANTDPGKEVAVDIIRKGKTETVNVQLGKLPGSEVASTRRSSGPTPSAKTEFLPGVEVASLTEDARNRVNLPRGMNGVVVTSVNPSSNAASAGLRNGDVVVGVNRQEVSSPADAANASKNAAGRVIVLRVFNQSGSRFMAVERD
ncbi:MAG: PDZ domain-containing protein, partial [Verrucomicrobiota bacterium]